MNHDTFLFALIMVVAAIAIGVGLMSLIDLARRWWGS